MATKERRASAPKPAAPPALPTGLARLPHDAVQAIEKAVMSGRYMIAVYQLDTSSRHLNLFRYTQDIPPANNDVAVNLLRDNLKNG